LIRSAVADDIGATNRTGSALGRALGVEDFADASVGVIADVDPTGAIKCNRGWKVEPRDVRRAVNQARNRSGKRDDLSGNEDQTDCIIEGVGHQQIAFGGNGKTVRRVELSGSALTVK
jgi:hypothetical protein